MHTNSAMYMSRAAFIASSTSASSVSILDLLHIATAGGSVRPGGVVLGTFDALRIHDRSCSGYFSAGLWFNCWGGMYCIFFFPGLFLGCAGRKGRMGVGMGMGMYHTVAGERGGIPHPYRRRGEETRGDEGVNIKRNFFLVILSARC